MRLMAEPLPAASRPSKRTTTRAPVSMTHCCMVTSSACSRPSSFSYVGVSSLRVPFAVNLGMGPFWHRP